MGLATRAQNDHIKRAVAARFFSPPGRRWPEGSDEGEILPDFGELAPSSRCRDLLPGGEKKQATPARSMKSFSIGFSPVVSQPKETAQLLRRFPEEMA